MAYFLADNGTHVLQSSEDELFGDNTIVRKPGRSSLLLVAFKHELFLFIF
ncbi:hypothetical protein [Alteribacillus sp. HJP-4]